MSREVTEEQLQGTEITRLDGGTNYWVRIGQRLTISGRRVTKLSFKGYRVGDCTGATLTFTIRKVSDSSIVASKLYGNVSSIPLTLGWIEATFDAPVYVDEEVRILAEWGETAGGPSNHLVTYGSSPGGQKWGESQTSYQTSWVDYSDYAHVYIYTYSVPEVAPSLPGTRGRIREWPFGLRTQGYGKGRHGIPPLIMPQPKRHPR